MSHVDQVVKFIEANTAGAQLGASESSSGAADPFTGKSLSAPLRDRVLRYATAGGSRYQPGSDSAGGAGYSDPFTGSGAYRPGQSSLGSGGSASDPYTGK